jgi:hypothetical protein
MLYINQDMSFYRISPLQSTNRLIDAMINNVYQYRMNLIKAGRYNNFLTKLALEQSRIINIEFFKKTYPNIPIPEDFMNKKSLERAAGYLKNELLYKLVWRYRRWISFGSV